MPTVQRSYKIRAYPNGAQVRFLNHWFGCARWLWNWSLEYRIKAYKRRKESISGISIGRKLTQLKKLERFSWLQSPPLTCLTQTLNDQDVAFSHFFRRVKSGETPGFPRFRKRAHANGLRFQDVSPAKWIKGHMCLPKLGIIKLAENLPDVPCPDMATLKYESDGRYYITFSAEVEINTLPVTGKKVGVDLGITHLAIASDGTKTENPKKFIKRLRYLRQQQRILSRKQKGSNRREKQRLKVAKIHKKIQNQRQYAAHQLTTKLVRENDVICIEDLKVSNMMKNRNLAKHIADAGWREIRRQLEYKCNWYGRTLVVVDQWFPSSKTCSACHHKLDELRLDVREWVCPKCNTVHDRDINASKNLLAEGMRQLTGCENRYLLADGAVVNAPREARTG